MLIKAIRRRDLLMPLEVDSQLTPWHSSGLTKEGK